MKPPTAEWAAKAEGDFLTAGRELRARKSPNYDAVCFHAQQCAEKYLKAVLQEHEKNITKIHNLVELMILCEEIDGSFEMLRADLIMMDRYSVCERAILVKVQKKKTLSMLTLLPGQHVNSFGRNWE